MEYSVRNGALASLARWPARRPAPLPQQLLGRDGETNLADAADPKRRLAMKAIAIVFICVHPCSSVANSRFVMQPDERSVPQCGELRNCPPQSSRCRSGGALIVPGAAG